MGTKTGAGRSGRNEALERLKRCARAGCSHRFAPYRAFQDYCTAETCAECRAEGRKTPCRVRAFHEKEAAELRREVLDTLDRAFADLRAMVRDALRGAEPR